MMNIIMFSNPSCNKDCGCLDVYSITMVNIPMFCSLALGYIFVYCIKKLWVSEISA